MNNITKEFLSFLDKSPSPFHACDNVRKKLVNAGFTEIKERNSFPTLSPNSSYFFTRNQSALVAFSIGGKFVPGNGFSIIGAHTDSPCLKVRPVSKKTKVGYMQVGVETYGGGLWHTWFDRDLGIAGRVLVDGVTHTLVNVNKPILRIPNLAIHLTENRKDFVYNKETHLTPILGIADKLNEKEEGKHHSVFMNLLANELNVSVDRIGDFELCLYDTQAPAVGGINDEFIHSARLDNLGMSYCATQALVNSLPSLENDTNVRMIALFDNEEVGSVSTAGADGNLLLTTLQRLCDEKFELSILKSMLLSADMAHGIHPNYTEKHEEKHRPMINSGVVIKQNANQRYATSSVTTAILRQIAKSKNLTLQEFVVRNDSPCGSTIGPMLSAKLGMRTIDVGTPQWSMHSCRETCGTKDIEHAVHLFEGFFEHLSSVDAKMNID